MVWRRYITNIKAQNVYFNFQDTHLQRVVLDQESLKLECSAVERMESRLPVRAPVFNIQREKEQKWKTLLGTMSWMI